MKHPFFIEALIPKRQLTLFHRTAPDADSISKGRVARFMYLIYQYINITLSKDTLDAYIRHTILKSESQMTTKTNKGSSFSARRVPQLNEATSPTLRKRALGFTRHPVHNRPLPYLKPPIVWTTRDRLMVRPSRPWPMDLRPPKAIVEYTTLSGRGKQCKHLIRTILRLFFVLGCNQNSQPTTPRTPRQLTTHKLLR